MCHVSEYANYSIFKKFMDACINAEGISKKDVLNSFAVHEIYKFTADLDGVTPGQFIDTLVSEKYLKLDEDGSLSPTTRGEDSFKIVEQRVEGSRFCANQAAE